MKRVTSLRFRITLYLIIAIVLTLAVITMAVDQRVDNEVSQRADISLLERAQALADIYNIAGSPTDIPLPLTFLDDDGIVYYMIDCKGERELSSAEAGTMQWPRAETKQPVFMDMTDHLGTQLRGIALRFMHQRDRGLASASGQEPSAALVCVVNLAANQDESNDFQKSLDKILFSCVVIGFLAVAALSPLLVKQGLRPLAHLAEAMKDIGPDASHKRLGDTGATELQPLVARFNEVLSRMEEGLLRERQFASGVAHELRTPLAELRNLIEVELRYPSNRDLRIMLADVGSIGIEMEQLVAALLLLTRIEGGIEPSHLQQVDVSSLSKKLLERHQNSIAKQQLKLIVSVESGVIWSADPVLLDVVLNNLISNAAAYAPHESTIRLHCSAREWFIENAAPDLSSTDVAMMSQRFWRKGKDAGTHTGLGLSLVMAAAQRQLLTIQLSLREGILRAHVHYSEQRSLAR